MPPGIGLAVAGAAAALAAAIAWAVFRLDWMARTDLAIARWLQTHADPTLTSLMLAVSWLHATPAVWVASIALLGYFAVQRQPAWFVLTLIVLPGGTLFNWGLKHLFQRPRPTEGSYVQSLHSFSFPSGHTIAATLFYGLLALWLISGCRTFARRAAVALVALACIATVAFSRIYLGVHFLSDVIAAFCAGVFWLALWTTIVSGLAARQASHPMVKVNR